MQFEFITTNDTKTEKHENDLFRFPQHLRVDMHNYCNGNRFKDRDFSDMTEAPEGANHTSLTEGEIGYSL